MAAGGPLTAEKQRLLHKVLESKIFSKAPKRREFLRYICEHALAGQTDPVHEREIGVAVYQRNAEYDPSEDNIVRVEARNLRKQLEQFFRTEGAAEPLVLRIPKGKYAPVFEDRRASDQPPASPLPASTLPSSRRSLALAAVLLVCLTFGLTRFVGGLTSDSGAAASIPPHPLWSSLFDQSRETYLVVADSNFASLQTYLGRTLSLEDYLKPGFGLYEEGAGVSSEVPRVLERFSATPATSYADVALAVKIMRLPWALRTNTTIRFARHINVRDFKSKNAILLGSVCSNPWAELWEPRLNFSIVHDHDKNQAWIENAAPRAGEQQRYPEDAGPSYALVALAPNLNGTGSVLLLAGIGMDGTEAAGDLVTSDVAFRKVADELRLVADGKLSDFEAVLEFSSVQGAPAKEPHVVAYRLLSPAPGPEPNSVSDSVWPSPAVAAPN
jgi:hypothetical protein